MKGTFIKALSLTLLIPAFSAFAMEDADVVAAMRTAREAAVAAPVASEVAKDAVTVVTEGAKAAAETAKEVVSKVAEVAAPVVEGAKTVAQEAAQVVVPAAQTVAQTVAPVIIAAANTVSGAVAPAIDAAVKTVAPEAAQQVTKTALTNASSSAATNVATDAAKTTTKEAAKTVAKQGWKEWSTGLLSSAKDGVVSGTTYVWNSAKAHPYIASATGVLAASGLGYFVYSKINNRKAAKAIDALPANVKATVTLYAECVAHAEKSIKTMSAEQANAALYDMPALEKQVSLLQTIKAAVESNAKNPQRVAQDAHILALFGKSVVAETMPALVALDVTLGKLDIPGKDGKPTGDKITHVASFLRDMKKFDEAMLAATDVRSEGLIKNTKHIVGVINYFVTKFQGNFAIAKRNAANAQPVNKADAKAAKEAVTAPANAKAAKAAKPAQATDKVEAEKTAADKPGFMKRSLNFVVADFPTWKSRTAKGVALAATAGTAFWLGKGKGVVAPAA